MPQLSKKRRAVFKALHKLINEAIHSYKSSNLNFKQWKRFWKKLNAYNSGKTYRLFLGLNYYFITYLLAIY